MVSDPTPQDHLERFGPADERRVSTGLPQAFCVVAPAQHDVDPTSTPDQIVGELLVWPSPVGLFAKRPVRIGIPSPARSPALLCRLFQKAAVREAVRLSPRWSDSVQPDYDHRPAQRGPPHRAHDVHRVRAPALPRLRRARVVGHQWWVGRGAPRGDRAVPESRRWAVDSPRGGGRLSASHARRALGREASHCPRRRAVRPHSSRCRLRCARCVATVRSYRHAAPTCSGESAAGGDQRLGRRKGKDQRRSTMTIEAAAGLDLWRARLGRRWRGEFTIRARVYDATARCRGPRVTPVEAERSVRTNPWHRIEWHGR
jgi:hypothetical protein